MPALAPFLQPRESTKVSDETERKIPLRVWRDSCFLGFFMALCAFGIGYLVHLQVCKWTGRAQGWADRAWSFTLMNWPILSVVVLLVWILFTGLLVYRFQIENVSKHGPPVRDLWPARLGMWTPWAGRRLRRADQDRYAEVFGRDDES
jgi:hypothetical protein